MADLKTSISIFPVFSCKCLLMEVCLGVAASFLGG